MSKKKTIIENRKARYNYEIKDKIEAGIVLKGSEIKSIRDGKISLDGTYAGEKNGEMWIFNLHIDFSNTNKDFDSSLKIRPRKLLLKKKEIRKFSFKVKNDGFTIVPLNIHFNKKGFAKVELGLSKGRKKSDLREYKKQQDWKREKERLTKLVK